MAVLREHPYGSFNFLVDFGDGGATDAQAGFMEVTGLSAEAVVVEYRNGNERELNARKLSGLSKFGDVVLKRGVIGSTSFWEWFRQTRDGTPDRRTVVVQLMSEDRASVVMTWKLRSAFPIRYDGPELHARSTDIAVEALTLAVESIDVE